MNASKGTQEYRVGEIFLSATPATQAQALDNVVAVEWPLDSDTRATDCDHRTLTE